ncbi:MAG TPA: carboxypeptidase-like regulatory domain-containing protein, partial [Gemmatimonadaceae bacterium]|nr:carboxypeptidase-like regulatory domain-containing protein [Gemmatimonadaceae bacterium]
MISPADAVVEPRGALAQRAKRWHAAVAWVLALVLLAAPPMLRAQVAGGRPETVRGRVSSDSAGALVGATVIVTRGPDRLVQRTTTDSTGRYSVRFDPGTGDYLVHVAAPTYRSARRRVQRDAAAPGGPRELVADFVLASDVTTLAAVRVQARRPTRASAGTTAMNPETGSADRWVEGVHGQLPPSSAGDLGALAGTIPGVTMTPMGPSILGAAAEANLSTLNGLGTAAATMPRAARTQTRVTGATFDPTRGGFAGANVDVRLPPGSRDFQQRAAFVTLAPQALQFTDRVGRELGARSGGVVASLGADGELIRRALTYNVALDVSRTVTDARTLFESDRVALRQAGISPDSVARLAAAALPIGLPAPRFGGRPDRVAVTWLGRLDDTRDSLDTRALTTYVSHSDEEGLGAGPLSAATALGRRGGTTVAVQATW